MSWMVHKKKKKKLSIGCTPNIFLWLLLPFISKGSFRMLEERWLTPLSPPSLFSGFIDHLTHVCLGNWQMTGHGEARSHLDLQGKQGLQSCFYSHALRPPLIRQLRWLTLAWLVECWNENFIRSASRTGAVLLTELGQDGSIPYFK